MKETLHIYTRVSTTIQEDDGTSLHTQKELGIERSKKLGMKYKLWNEGSQSSSKDDLSNRPVLSEVLQKIDDGEIKHLYVWNTDRLSRNLNTWGMIRFKLIKEKVHLHTPTGEQLLEDIQTNLMIGVLSEISHYENQLRTERFRLGKLKRVKDGYWKGGAPPFGYRLENGLLVVEESESEWLVKIHEWYRDGQSVDEIRNQLMNNGVMTRRGNAVWSHGSINAVLTNTHQDGYWYFKDKKSEESVRVNCPRICSPELIQGVKTEMKKRSYKVSGSQRSKTGVTKYPYLLTKIMRCGSCGSLYYGNLKKTTKQTSYYHCGQKVSKFKTKHTDKFVDCGSNRNLRLDTTETLVWGLVKEVIESSNLFKETVKQEVLGSESSQRDLSAEKKVASREVDKLNEEVSKITSSIVSLTTENLLSESRDLKQVIKKLEEKRLETEVKVEKITRDLQQVESQSRWIDWLKEFKSRINKLDSLDATERQTFIRGVVSEIVVKEVDNQKHQLEIKFHFPYVGDKIIYDDPDKKSKGYRVVGGRKSKTRTLDLLKKF